MAVEVYAAMCADVIHRGHVNMLLEASKYGKVTVGLLSDGAIATFKRVPYTTYEDRYAVISSLKTVHDVIRQDVASPVPYIINLKPRYYVHGDDWNNPREAHVRDAVIKALEKNGGALIEPPYTVGVSSTAIQADLLSNEKYTHPGSRRLFRALAMKDIVRAYPHSSSAEARILDQLSSGRKRVDAHWYVPPAWDDECLAEELFAVLEATDNPVICDFRSLSAYELLPKLGGRIVRMGFAGVVVAHETVRQRPQPLDDFLSGPFASNGLLAIAHKVSDERCAALPSLQATERADVHLFEIAGKDELSNARLAFERIAKREDACFGVIASCAVEEDLIKAAGCNVALYGEFLGDLAGRAPDIRKHLSRISHSLI